MSSNEINAFWPGWETVRLIGRGSFGAVYEIERYVLGEKEKAALKVITIPQSSSDIDELYGEGYDEESITSTFTAYLKSIVAEYSLMRKMNGSANVVNCDDVRYVQHDDGFGWDIFIKMELLTPLTKALGKDVSDEQIVRIGLDICKALILCKKHSIIHRDIKPANIFVSENGDYKLGDFGIAKTVEKTSGGTKIGTYEYMAPEVYHDQPYGSTVDIYSLGMVLYWLLNERRTPFLKMPPSLPTNSEKEQARKRRFGGETIPAPVHGSDELKRIVLKACAYDPKDRYQSAEKMLIELEKLGSSSYVTLKNSSSSSSQSIQGVAFASDDDATVSALYSAQEKDETDTVDALVGDRKKRSCATTIAELDEQGSDEDETVGAFGYGAPQIQKESTHNKNSATTQKKKGSYVWIAICVFAVAVGILFFVTRTHREIQHEDTPDPPTVTEADEYINVVDVGGNTVSTILQSLDNSQKVGFLIARDENAPADLFFIQRCEEICLTQGISYIIKTGVWADSAYNAALELVDSGCTTIFSNNPNNEAYLIQAAKERPEADFWQVYGERETEVGISNYHCVDFIYGNEDATTEITVVVIHSDITSNKYIICTDQAYLGAALKDLWLISGNETQYGLLVTTVDSEYADPSKQQWILRKNGELVLTGIDDTELINGDLFEFALTIDQ